MYLYGLLGRREVWKLVTRRRLGGEDTLACAGERSRTDGTGEREAKRKGRYKISLSFLPYRTRRGIP